MKIRHLFFIAALSGCLFSAGCSSDSSSDTPAAAGAGPAGGPVEGPADTHCEGVTPVTVDPAACTTPENSSEGGASGDAPSASEGGSDCNQTHDDEYGATLPNSAGDDDDCKYHAAWTSSPIRLNEDVTFTVKAQDLISNQGLDKLDDGDLPLTRVELYQPCDPTRRGPAQNAKATFQETAPGEFTAGPFRFDQSGRWVVRFHFYEECLDGEGSPHGHIAFFVDVP